MRKVFVGVIAEYTNDGSVKPLTVIWENGKRYDIDRVMDIRRAASLKAGGIGIRYTCRIAGKRTYLYLDDTRWYMEGKDVPKDYINEEYVDVMQ